MHLQDHLRRPVQRTHLKQLPASHGKEDEMSPHPRFHTHPSDIRPDYQRTGRLSEWEEERLLKRANIGMSVDKVLNMAKSVTAFTIRKPNGQ